MTENKDALLTNMLTTSRIVDLFINIDEALELHFNKLIEMEQRIKKLEAQHEGKSHKM